MQGPTVSKLGFFFLKTNMGKRTNSLSFTLLLALLLLSGLRSGAAAIPPVSDTGWADSVLHQLTLEQKIAQLIMMRMHSNKDQRYNDTMVAQIQRHQVGGVCFSSPAPQCRRC